MPRWTNSPPSHVLPKTNLALVELWEELPALVRQRTLQTLTRILVEVTTSPPKHKEVDDERH